MVIGGNGKSSCEIYDIASASWSVAPTLLAKRNETCAVVGGRAYAFGGSNLNASLNTAEVYEENAKTGIGKWWAISSMPNKRRNAVALVIDDKVLVMGGSYASKSHGND